jgi:hypothetical protein
MSASHRPYFLWDYDLTEGDVRAILAGKDEDQKAWIVARLLESARYADVWKYISLADLKEIFPKLKLKPQVRAAWEFALLAWSADSHHER